MTAKQGAESRNELEKLIGQYEVRLREIKHIDISEISFEEMEKLCSGFELEMNSLDSEEASELPEEIRASLKHRYQMIIRRYKTIMEEILPFNEIFTELTNLKIPLYKRDEVAFERQISTARQELEKIKSDKTIGLHFKHFLTLRYERELKRLDEEVIDQILSCVSQEISATIMQLYQTNVK